MGVIEYFVGVLESGSRAEELAGDRRPVVGTFCNFVPDEVVMAAGAVPVRLDSGDEAAAAEAEGALPKDCCPVARAGAGMLARRSGIHSLVGLLVVPSSCDAKVKLGASLDGGVPVHVMSLPASKSGPGSATAWLGEVRRLAERLRAVTGRAVTARSLREAVEITNRRQAAFRALLELRCLSPPKVTGREVLLIAQASFIDDPVRFTERLAALVRERQSAAAPSSVGPRVLLTGAPIIHPNTRLVDIIEAAGASVVADDLCTGTERLYHPVVPMEWSLPEVMRAVAEKALLPSTCPCFSDHEDRLNRVLGLVDECAAQGVIYHNLRTCMLFQFETRHMREALRKRAVPMLEVTTDYGGQDTEQLRTRVEAFTEMLAAGRT